MKKKHEYAFFSKGKWRKILLIMKLKLFILLCCIQSVNATVFSQEQKLDICYVVSFERFLARTSLFIKLVIR